MLNRVSSIGFFLILSLAGQAFAEDLTPDLKKKLVERFIKIEKIASNDITVAATRARNAAMPDELKTMNQETWATATILDKTVRTIGKNDLSELLKAAQKDDPAIAEAFVSAADGSKVAFISKTTNWSHKGKPKHEVPMESKQWIGPIEVDKSSGVKQVQISVPILVDGKPAGSLVVGYQVMKL